MFYVQHLNRIEKHSEQYTRSINICIVLPASAYHFFVNEHFGKNVIRIYSFCPREWCTERQTTDEGCDLYASVRR